MSTSKDMQSLLGLERQKQLLGCSDHSCMVEIANALGVDALAGGEIAKLGEVFQVNLKIISATSGQAIATYQGSATDEGGVLDVLNGAASVLASDAAESLGKTVPKAGGKKGRPSSPSFHSRSGSSASPRAAGCWAPHRQARADSQRRFGAAHQPRRGERARVERLDVSDRRLGVDRRGLRGNRPRARSGSCSAARRRRGPRRT